VQPLSLRLLSKKLKAAAAQNGPEQPSTIIFNSADALQIGSNEAASLVVLETSSLENAETDDTVSVSLVFTDGSSTPFQPAASGLEARTAQEVEIRHAADKALQSVSVRLSGNDAVHFSEVRVEFGEHPPLEADLSRWASFSHRCPAVWCRLWRKVCRGVLVVSLERSCGWQRVGAARFRRR